MRLDSLMVQNFRPFEQVMYTLSPQVTIISGPNTRGKTSLLEAIHTVLHGTGFRESKEGELIRWDQPMANVAAQMVPDGQTDGVQFQVMLRTIAERVQKHYFIDKTQQSLQRYSKDQVASVLFAPENIEIITGSPRRRRQYLDRVLSTTDQQYKKNLQNYENALRKRNKLLEQHRNPTELKTQLQFWDQYLAEQAAYLTRQRQGLIAYANEHHQMGERSYQVVYLENLLTQERLEERFALEQRMRKTSIGPQKDDIEILQQQGERQKNVALYGSRSEQRLAMFWMKLIEIAYIEQTTGRRPILLLDDVFSELDTHNKEGVIGLLNQYQTILTTTDPDLPAPSSVAKQVIAL